MSLTMLGCRSPVPTEASKRSTAETETSKTAVAEGAGIDLSGTWECMWDLPGASGDESWTVMQDGDALTVTLRGSDPGGRYSGSMSGTLTGRSVELTYKYHDGTRGTMSLRAAANGKVLDGESVRASGKARPQHYACSSDAGGGAGRGRSRTVARAAEPTADCTRHTGVAYLEDCQQACWAAGRLGEDKCREKCTAYCKPRP